MRAESFIAEAMKNSAIEPKAAELLHYGLSGSSAWLQTSDGV